MPDDIARARAILVEVERLYNHAADLGALADDAGFALANAHTLRIREQLLRINNLVTGHRLLRGTIHPGGITLRATPDPATIAADIAEITALTLGNAVVHDRFAGTSIVTQDKARKLGCLGPAARRAGSGVGIVEGWRGTIVPDFPLTNKSFNLSYAGNDL